MTGSVAVDVAIGLVFIYLIYSLLATILFELIASMLNMRANNLAAAIDRMLADQTDPKRWWLVRDKANLTQDVLSFLLWNNTLSRVIQDFCMSIVRVFYKPYGKLTRAFFNSPEIKYQATGTLFNKPSYIRANSFSKAIIDLFKERGAQMGATDFERIQNYIAGLRKDHPETAKYLESLVVEAKGDIEKFQLLLEQWFDKMMERCAGWYKRKTQWVLLVIGFVLAIGFNVDTIKIVNILASSPEQRKQLVDMAIRIDKEKDSLNLVDTTKDAAQREARKKFLEGKREKVQLKIDSANAVLGLGWKDEKGNLTGVQWSKIFGDMKILFGLILTAIAISMGSPFWFDLLSKFIKIRGVGARISSIDSADKYEKAEREQKQAVAVTIHNKDSKEEAIG